MPEEKVLETGDEFSKVWNELDAQEKEKPEKVVEDEVKEPPEKIEEEKGEEVKEEKVEEKKEEVKDLEGDKEHRRRSILGRIQSSMKGAKSLEETYRRDYGQLPWEKSPEQMKKAEETKKVVERVSTDLPEVAETVRHLIDERLQQLEGRFSEFATTTEAKTQMVAHEAAIRVTHPDLDSYRNPEALERKALEEWIGTLPYVNGVECSRILRNGNASEVSDLLSVFKEAIDNLAEELDKTKTSVETQKKVNVSAQNAERVRGGGSAAVVSRGAIDPNDFASGWKEHERQYG